MHNVFKWGKKLPRVYGSGHNMSTKTDVIGANFLEDLEVTRYSFKKKSEQVYLSYKPETSEIICGICKTGKIDCTVSLYEVKEIRPGKHSKDFERLATDTKKVEGSRCFVIFYGTDFRLKTLSIAFEQKKDADNWMKSLEYLIDKNSSLYLVKLDIWIVNQFESIPSNGQGVSLKQMREFTNRISFKISTGKLREKFQIYEENGRIKFEGFSSLTSDFLHDQQIFTDCFGKYALGGRIDLKGFEEFLKTEQRERHPSEYMPFFREFSRAGCKGTPFMTVSEAVNFLFSKQNQAWDTKYDAVYQDMNRPLSHYWIASSHNTYLTGDQLSSESSIEAYARALRQGCRCIELDCWDGDNDMPVIYHGRTLTTKVLFLDVIKTIRDHAFVTSEYPVILSIENHCSVKQQRTMAKKFEDVFGRMLVINPVNRDETSLPSPQQLRRRIILKCKKLPKDDKEIIDATEKDKGLDLCDTVKNGKMYIQGTNSSSWAPYFFALTNDKLIYTEIDEGRDVDNESADRRSATIEDLHFSKKWFHGKVHGGVRAAEERVKKFGIEGSFLVRNSDTFPGEFSLCFLSQGRAHHIRIKTNSEQTLFYLVPSKTFDSLYSLISYYRKCPLETKDFYIEKFTKPVPQPEKHETEPWFYPNPKYPGAMDRKSAEDILQRIPLNGAFLVRYSSEPTSARFVISFRMEKHIKHCRIKENGRLLIVSTQKFENIEKLVQYYQNHAFYKGLKLKHPVTEELMRFSQSVENPEEVYKSPDYLDTNLAQQIQVQAIYSHTPDDPELLRFEKGDIIMNVLKQDGGWWRGDFEDQFQKLFPYDYVEEVENIDSPFGELQKGSVSLGKADIEKGTDETFSNIVRIWTNGSPLPFKAALKTMREAKEWQEAINYVNTRTNKKMSQSGRIEKKNKIAKEFSKLVVYCCAVPKISPEEVRSRGRIFNEMASYNENLAEKQMGADPMFYVWYHEVQFSRVYPKGQRVDSSNYNPIRFWVFGCQMAALNYQTPDKPMQLNHGKFRQNGKCGYILRPEFMFKKNFDPTKVKELVVNDIKPMTFKITIIAARHLSRSGNKPITNPYIEVEIFGADFDCQKVRTAKVIPDNGLNPFWNEKFTIKVLNPDVALIRFGVSDEDPFGDSHFLGQATYPARCLLQGYRSIPLENGFGEELLSSLLIHITFT